MKKWINVEDIIDDILAEDIIVKEIKHYAEIPSEKIIPGNEDIIRIHVMSEKFSKEINDEN